MKGCCMISRLWSGLLLAVVAASLASGARGAGETLKGVVGDTELAYRVEVVAPHSVQALEVRPGGDLLCVTEAYPDLPQPPRYAYDLTVAGRLICRRDYSGMGFGPTSYFVALPEWARGAATLQLANTGNVPVRVLGVRSVSRRELGDIEKADSFGLFGLVIWHEGRQWAEEIVAKMPCREGFYRGFATEIPYARWSGPQLASQMEETLTFAKEHDFAFLPLLVSWWAGTPIGIPDGEGGTFGDLKYQQICWSLDDNEDEGPAFRALLGERWNSHYGLSVPNEWSDTPWLTMNSQTLNDYRYRRLDEAVKLLGERLATSPAKLAGICLENEPRYWDTPCEDGNPKRQWGITWADFNPVVIAAAKQDGVTLDPADGLAADERLWLHRNVSRYNQALVDETLKSLKAAGRTGVADLYTHSLQLVGFPGDEIGHAMSEWAYASGARTGLEGIWMRLADLDRVREWGPWANINREETDGKDIKVHLWDLRVTYARGGDLYNSYNWQAVGSDRFFAYVQQFLDDLPATEVPAAGAKPEGPAVVSFATALEAQGANRSGVTLDLATPLAGALLATVRDGAARIIGFARTEGPFVAGSQEVEFVFAEPFELPSGQRGTLKVEAEGAAQTAGLAVQGARFYFDLRRERTQSLYVIRSSSRSPAPPK